MKRILCILLLLACIANAETWIYGRSRLSTGYRQEKNNGKIPFSLYPPALWYEFNYNDGSIVYDESGNNNTGTVTGATWVSDETGGHYSFDADYITCGNLASLQITNDLTLSMWVRTAATNGVNTLISKLSATRGYELHYDSRPAYLLFRFYVAPSSSTLRLFTSGVTNITDDTWHHIVAVFDAGTSMKVYCDGIDLGGSADGAIPASQYAAANNVDIGRRPGTTDSYFYGDADSATVNNSAWTSNQVYNLYQRGR